MLQQQLLHTSSHLLTLRSELISLADALDPTLQSLLILPSLLFGLVALAHALDKTG